MFFRFSRLKSLFRKSSTKSEIGSGMIHVRFDCSSLDLAEVQKSLEVIQAGAATGLWRWHCDQNRLGLRSPWRFRVNVVLHVDSHGISVQLTVSGDTCSSLAPEPCREVFQSMAGAVLTAIGLPVSDNEVGCTLVFLDGTKICPWFYPHGVSRSLAMV